MVSFFALFRYADSTDKLQIFIGTICALGVGTSFPFFMIFFGDILAVFVETAREKAAANAFEVTIKFVIIGGITWLLSTNIFDYRLDWALLLATVRLKSVTSVQKALLQDIIRTRSWLVRFE